jgi:hypothetical protein
MLEIDAVGAVLLLVIAALFALVVTRQRALPRATAEPNTELARAVRLLDRILAVDDAFPQLPTDLRDEAKRITATYYRELDE